MPWSSQLRARSAAPAPLSTASGETLYPRTGYRRNSELYEVPHNLRVVFTLDLENQIVDELGLSPEQTERLKKARAEMRAILEEGPSRANYSNFFHHLLWWEEVVQTKGVKELKFNNVKCHRLEDEIITGRRKLLVSRRVLYAAEVPELDKRPQAVTRGNCVTLHTERSMVFEATIRSVSHKDSSMILTDLHPKFEEINNIRCEYEMRLVVNRSTLQNMHAALDSVPLHRLFPERALTTACPRTTIDKYLNELVEKDAEQRAAVARILGDAGKDAPFLLVGPPGTGKTATLVEAVLQVVRADEYHRVLVCAPSNAAADHAAHQLLRAARPPIPPKFLIRVNSQSREWEAMPAALHEHSNGHSRASWEHLTTDNLTAYRVVVATLSHAASYGRKEYHSYDGLRYRSGLEATHLFVDEAGQATEPAVLVALNLLRESGALVLCGDPRQLGPVCSSPDAQKQGLGKSMMERLLEHWGCAHDWKLDSPHLVMLRTNYRSHPDILRVINERFYNNLLKPEAPPDPLSAVDLGVRGASGGGAIVFHAVNSHQQQDELSTSFYNTEELEVLQIYITKLLNEHHVAPTDIGVVTPYAAQVELVQLWVEDAGEAARGIEVGSVEAFQGREKRVILVSTVRHDGLGFVADDKRFNVTVTRAKAKLVVVGNRACLARDPNWHDYLRACDGTQPSPRASPGPELNSLLERLQLNDHKSHASNQICPTTSATASAVVTTAAPTAATAAAATTVTTSTATATPASATTATTSTATDTTKTTSTATTMTTTAMAITTTATAATATTASHFVYDHDDSFFEDVVISGITIDDFVEFHDNYFRYSDSDYGDCFSD